jgi:hypothetical protein
MADTTTTTTTTTTPRPSPQRCRARSRSGCSRSRRATCSSARVLNTTMPASPSPPGGGPLHSRRRCASTSWRSTVTSTAPSTLTSATIRSAGEPPRARARLARSIWTSCPIRASTLPFAVMSRWSPSSSACGVDPPDGHDRRRVPGDGARRTRHAGARAPRHSRWPWRNSRRPHRRRTPSADRSPGNSWDSWRTSNSTRAAPGERRSPSRRRSTRWPAQIST